MRLADLLVDLAAVASASKSVAAKHVALRARQVERYGQTSSILRDALLGRQKAAQGQKEEPPNVERGDEEKATPPAAAETHQQPEPPKEKEVSGTIPKEAPPPPPPPEETTQPAPTPEKKRPTQEFKPAPWAEGSIALLKQGFVPPRRPPTSLPSIGKQKIDIPLLKVDETEEVDVSSLFHTSKGSKILEALKSKEDETKEAAGEYVQVAEAGKTENKVVEKEEEQPSKEVDSAPAVKAVIFEPTKEEEQPSKEVDSAPAVKAVIFEPTKEVVAEPVKEVVSKPLEEAVSEPIKEVVSEPLEEVLSTPEKEVTAEITPSPPPPPPPAQYELRESRVPSTRLGRLWNYGGLAAGMLAGAVTESVSRTFNGSSSSSSSSVMLSPSNMTRLVSKLSRMRGAALKLGQMMSFQDAKMLPPPIQEVLQRVQDRADYMPSYQRDRVLGQNLGENWRELFSEFDEKPIAAASIGQVHRAVLKQSGERVAVKIQFPGVAESINSDLDNIAVLLTATKLLPKGLYLDKTIENARLELGWECDYEREAGCAERYRQNLLSDEVFAVPGIYPEASGRHVLTMEWMSGTGVTRIAPNLSQEQKDWIGTQILRLCLREITEFKFMQTDPNWTNFLYNPQENKLELLDFGASREYPDSFIKLYVQLLEASSRNDKDAVKELSEELGYLTGHESKQMLEAHLTSVMTLAEPFMETAPEVYDFRDQTITERVKAQIGVMIHERLAPPPEETYSLHRKLSGAFLLCARLGSRVRCRELFQDALEKSGYKKD